MSLFLLGKFLWGKLVGLVRREVHIFTCGVSLVTNTAKRLLGRGLFDRIGEDKLEGLSDGKTVNSTFNALSGDEEAFFEGEMLRYVEEDPKRASAELNAFLTYLESKGVDLGEARGLIERVYLLVSATKAGELAGRVIERYLSGKGLHPSVEKITHFQSMDFERALEELKETVRHLIPRFASVRGRKVLLNLTGGFKAEIAALSALASENGLDAYYIHETSRKVVMLPPSRVLRLRVLQTSKDVAQSIINLTSGVLAPIVLLVNPWLTLVLLLSSFSLWLILKVRYGV